MFSALKEFGTTEDGKYVLPRENTERVLFLYTELYSASIAVAFLAIAGHDYTVDCSLCGLLMPFNQIKLDDG